MDWQDGVAIATLAAAGVAAVAGMASVRQGRRAERRATDRSDVAWAADVGGEGGIVTVTQIGEDPALMVKLTVRWTDMVVRGDRATMLPGAALEVEIPRKNFIPGIGPVAPNVHVAVEWSSESGVPYQWSTTAG